MVGLQADSSRFRLPFSRVLVVEDEPRIRRALVAIFQDWGAEVRQASRVEGALAALEAPEPDLVVLDVRLPDGNGRAIVEATNLLSPRPTLIATSGLASAREAFELAQLGVEPFPRFSFESRVRAFLREEEAPGSGEMGSSLSPETRALVTGRLSAFAAIHGLSVHEQELVRLAIAGVPRKRIPDILGVTDNTCKTRIRRLLRKCDADHLADIPRMLLLHSYE